MERKSLVNAESESSVARTARERKIDSEPFFEVGVRSGLVRGTFNSLSEIWTHRELLGRLINREVKARYKDSSLGIVWSLFRPLAQLLIYYFAIGQVLQAARGVPDFAIFVFVGLTMWALAAEIISGSTTSILANAGLVKKVYLPREIFPLSAVGSAFVNFGIQLIVLFIGIVVLARLDMTWDLLLFPLSILLIATFCTAFGLLLAAINVYLRDIQHLVEIGLIVFFWASPIVYPFTFVHRALQGNWMEQAYLANPITIAIIGAQKALWSAGSTTTGQLAQTWPDNLGVRMLVALAVSVLLLWACQRIFSRLQGNFAQEL
jgi:ABC-2 type transport system permease protein